MSTGAVEGVVQGGCIRCGYDLRGLAREGVCPECGLDVLKSLEKPWLVDASPGWLRWQTETILWAGAVGGPTVTLLAILVSRYGYWMGSSGMYMGVLAVYLMSAAQIGVMWWASSRVNPIAGLGSMDARFRRALFVLGIVCVVDRVLSVGMLATQWFGPGVISSELWGRIQWVVIGAKCLATLVLLGWFMFQARDRGGAMEIKLGWRMWAFIVVTSVVGSTEGPYVLLVAAIAGVW